MFRLSRILFHKGLDKQEYIFTEHSFIYGPNAVGKTALAKIIDFMLGKSGPLIYAGTGGIEKIEAVFTNDKKELFLLRDLDGHCFYKAKEDSPILLLSLVAYKEKISNIVGFDSGNENENIYKIIYGELPTYRTMSFLNKLDEKGLGDLQIIFTAAKEEKYLYRIRDIVEFLFNYKNVKAISVLQSQIIESEKYIASMASVIRYRDELIKRARELSESLGLQFNEKKLAQSEDLFKQYSNDFSRKVIPGKADYHFLQKTSFSLSENIKTYSYIDSQVKNILTRRDKGRKLMSLFSQAMRNNAEYEKYVLEINSIISRIESDDRIVSSINYQKIIKSLKAEKNKIDEKLREFQSLPDICDYRETLRKIDILSGFYCELNKSFPSNEIEVNRELIKNKTEEIRKLKNAYDYSLSDKYNKLILDYYLNSKVEANYKIEDKDTDGFAIVFNPLKVCMSTSRLDDSGKNVTYDPGSMARMTHIQTLAYLSMFDLLKNSEASLPLLPILVIDSANQVMENKNFESFYGDVIEIARKNGIQTIFMSKDKLNSVDDGDIIDISNGLNKFY